MAKNCDPGLEKAAAFSRPLSQFFATRTSQLANNIFISQAAQEVLVSMSFHPCLILIHKPEKVIFYTSQSYLT